MWTIFNTKTHEILAECIHTEIEAMMWISVHPDKDDLGYAPF